MWTVTNVVYILKTTKTLVLILVSVFQSLNTLPRSIVPCLQCLFYCICKGISFDICAWWSEMFLALLNPHAIKGKVPLSTFSSTSIKRSTDVHSHFSARFFPWTIYVYISKEIWEQVHEIIIPNSNFLSSNYSRKKTCLTSDLSIFRERLSCHIWFWTKCYCRRLESLFEG